MVWVAGGEMTNREAILRLSVNTGDVLAIASLSKNNADIIRGFITRYFGVGPVANKAECLLMERMASHARSYEHRENPDEWFAKYANQECDRLRNEAIHDKANSD